MNDKITSSAIEGLKTATNTQIKLSLLPWALFKDSEMTCDPANKELGHSVHYLITMLETP